MLATNLHARVFCDKFAFFINKHKNFLMLVFAKLAMIAHYAKFY